MVKTSTSVSGLPRADFPRRLEAVEPLGMVMSSTATSGLSCSVKRDGFPPVARFAALSSQPRSSLQQVPETMPHHVVVVGQEDLDRNFGSVAAEMLPPRVRMAQAGQGPSYLGGSG